MSTIYKTYIIVCFIFLINMEWLIKILTKWKTGDSSFLGAICICKFQIFFLKKVQLCGLSVTFCIVVLFEMFLWVFCRTFKWMEIENHYIIVLSSFRVKFKCCELYLILFCVDFEPLINVNFVNQPLSVFRFAVPDIITVCTTNIIYIIIITGP